MRATHLDDLVELGTLTPQAADFIEAAVVSGLNVLVAGGTQAGNTTLIYCLAVAVQARERVVTCEEVFAAAPATPVWARFVEDLSGSRRSSRGW